MEVDQKEAKHSIATHLVLLGDSTLDNVVWVDKPHESIASQLREALPDAVVSNYAADGFNSTDVLKGAIPNISRQMRTEANDPFPADESKSPVFKPLEHLQKLKDVTHAVLSVGGNDVREILARMDLLPARLAKFQSNYPAIVQEVLKTTPNIIMMLQYRPSFNMDDRAYRVYKAMSKLPGPATSVQKLNGLMETIYPPLFELAAKLGAPIIDLPRTFDIYNDALYRCQIEPSFEGGKIIARLITHVVNNHHFQDNQSKFYFVKDGAVCEEANDGSAWKIESAL